MIYIAVIICALIKQTICRQFYYLGFPVSYSTSFFTCLKNNGIDRIFITILSTQFGIIQQQAQNVFNAKSAGLQVQVRYTPCRSRKVEDQFQMLYTKFGLNTISKIWVFPYQSPVKCSWQIYPVQENCQYIQKYIDYFTSQKINIGVESCRGFWTTYFGGLEACKQASDNTQLWWIPMTTQQQDIQPNFNNYIQIGGWKKPYAKAYNYKQLCGQSLSVNYFQ